VTDDETRCPTCDSPIAKMLPAEHPLELAKALDRFGDSIPAIAYDLVAAEVKDALSAAGWGDTTALRAQLADVSDAHHEGFGAGVEWADERAALREEPEIDWEAQLTKAQRERDSLARRVAVRCEAAILAPTPDTPQTGTGAREVNWSLLASLRDRDHPLANIKAETRDLPLGVGEVLQEARVSHHLLDMAGVPNKNREHPDATDLDARVWLLLDAVIGLRQQRDRLIGWHSRETAPGGMVGDFCNECGSTWPCDTRRLLEGTYVDV
jgi:hypothetical protein